MSDWKELAHFLYGRGFWYANPLREIDGLKEEDLFWVPDPKSFCILWHVGHIAHRERTHIGQFLQGIEDDIIPPEFDVFGKRWASPGEVRSSISSVESVLDWVKTVREISHKFIDSIDPADYHRVLPSSHKSLPLSHWLFITTCHTALHVGTIQHLRALIEGTHDRAC